MPTPAEQQIIELASRISKLERYVEALRATEQLGLRAARVTHSTSQAWTPGLASYIAFNSEQFDYGGIHDNVTNNNRLTVPTDAGGFWLVMASVRYSAPSVIAATDFFETYLVVNNSFTLANDVRPPNPAGAGATTGVTIIGFYQMAAGDYFQLGFNNGSGGNVTVTQLTGLTPYFMALRIPT